MKKTFLFSVYCLLFTVCGSYAQVPADSLPGTYAGQYWYANPATNPWTITQDTEYITSIDSVNCILYGTGPINYTLGGYYCTEYYSCNSCTYTLKFYSGDSIHAIYDNIPQPPPNPPKSMRFYGKRISNLIYINSIENYKQVQIYPNPSNGILTIESEIKEVETEIIITDAVGKEVKSQKSKIKNGIIAIDVSGFKKGIYFLLFKTAKITLTKKIIIN